MSVDKKMRMERIERLLKELEYEVVRGFMEKEIDETIDFRFIVPMSHQLKGGSVLCEFRTRPMLRGALMGLGEHSIEPRLKVVK